MKWEKPKQPILDTFQSLIPVSREIEHKKMFGYPCCFIHGNMFIGVHNNHIVLRLSEEDREVFRKNEGAKVFEPMPGRPMREYSVMPETLLKNPKKTSDWIKKSIAYATSLPIKMKKQKKK
jgi:TfoX/Sxy family transcriptional regulator of competence genes